MHLSRCKWKTKGIWQSSRFVEFSWKHACEATSHEADVEALLSVGSVSKVYLPQAFPLPVMWITNFLEKRTPQATYCHLKLQTKNWGSMAKGKEAAKLAMTFAKVLLTEHPTVVEQKPSIIHILRNKQSADQPHRATTCLGKPAHSEHGKITC
jgi:hypothetical protein